MAKEKNEAIPEETLEERLEAKYGELGEDFVFITIDGSKVIELANKPVTCVFRRPDETQWATAREQLQSDKIKDKQAFKKLCYNCAAEPDKESLEAIFRRYSALPAKLCDELSNLVGADLEIVTKKE